MPEPLPAPFLVFDFADDAGAIQRRIFSQPEAVLVAHSVADMPDVLRAVEAASISGYWCAGYVAYEAAPAFDPAFVVRPTAAEPLAWFGVFSRHLPDFPLANIGEKQAYTISDWQVMTSPQQYAQMIARIRAAIGRGDVYQVNATTRLTARITGSGFACYERLARAQKAGYGAFVDTGERQILSLSPELFFRRQGETVITKPMKGTMRRGRWREEDVEHAARLAASEKNRAENLMIVDLLRNDLGRVARPGTVQVSDLFRVETYPTVLQMTSKISARVPPSTTLHTLFSALFPCGSITGAPKIAAMAQIAELENTPRGAYCGAIGFVEPGGDAVFNVAIRTLTRDKETGKAVYGTGGGIVWDSVAEDEAAEMATKAAFLTRDEAPFELLETLRLEEGRYILQDRHLARIAESASYFGFSSCSDAALSALEQEAVAAPNGVWRVRLLAAPDGTVRTERFALMPLPSGSLSVALAPTPVSSLDPFLCHKTTRRDVYEAAKAARPDVYDVLLWNENGELTEFTTGNLVAEIGGEAWTPPRTCGLLAGTLRTELLERGEIQERILTRSDLSIASHLWFINSVRGRIPATLIP